MEFKKLYTIQDMEEAWKEIKNHPKVKFNGSELISEAYSVYKSN